ncbi:MAG TPA: serine hydrolase domain-containing protein [Thermoanaerobaculia bacterium]|nr:serine hydrolase domain-containing protein [Thermoanaerobaculia bacterium]
MIALLLSLALQAPAPPAPAPDFAALEEVARAELAETGTPGAAIAVIQGGRAIYGKGLGVANIETGAPVTPTTLFHIGSLTKLMTAAAIVSEAEAGRLKLDQPVGDLVPGLAPKLARLTLHQLLSQTSGLKETPGEDGLHGEEALGAWVRSLKDEDLLVPPGTAFSYSNNGYALAGLALEAETGKPYAEAMEKALFQPMGMPRTTLRPTVAMTFPLAMGHTAKDKQPPTVVRPLADDTRLWPAGYAFTNLEDLARFVIALLNGGRVNGRQGMPPGVPAKLLASHVEIPTNVFVRGAYGYGLFLQDDRGLRRAEHGGELPGYGAEIRLFPEKRVGVIVLVNREGVRLNKTFDKAFDLFAGPSTPRESQTASELPMTEAERAAIVGKYENRWPMDVFVRDNRLFLRRFGAELPITRVGENRYSVTDGGRLQEFLIVPAKGGNSGYMQMFIWVFRKTG